MLVPTWVLLLYPDLSTEVIFQLKNTPIALLKLGSQLGMFLILHRSTLASQDVFITRHHPNLTGHVSVVHPLERHDDGNTIALASPSLDPDADAIRIKLQIVLDPQRSTLARLTTRFDLLATDLRDVLRQGATVNITQLSAFALAIEIARDF